MENAGEIRRSKSQVGTSPVHHSIAFILAGVEQPASLQYLSEMPYEVSFTKAVEVKDPGIYINDCCWGGDVVRDRLLPLIKAKFEDLWTAQEDWGWFIWFQRGKIRLAIDIFSDDRKGHFRLRLSSQRKRFLVGDLVIDTVELEEVRELVMRTLANWASDISVEHVK